MQWNFRNVNDAFPALVTLFYNEGSARVVRERFSNPNGSGDVLRVTEPVLITYENPWERVLFNPARDCNPFFHLYEALWTLAGHDDAASLNYYSSQIRKYSDDGLRMQGSYGRRWRAAEGVPRLDVVNKAGTVRGYTRPGVDQLEVIIRHLQANPASRRAVLTMWNVEDDLLHLDDSKDVCCNLNVLFSIRTKSQGMGDGYVKVALLDMTVTNRSNDLILGLLGTNYVVFSFLQEYVAARLGVQMGRYHHVTNNLHVYLNDRWTPERWLEGYKDRDMHSPDQFDYDRIRPVPLAAGDKGHVVSMDQQIKGFVETHRDARGLAYVTDDCEWTLPFLEKVAEPAIAAYHCHKQGAFGMALEHAARIRSEDWHIACTQWLQRRYK